nr:MAG TPA: CRISPR-associated endonuclease [Caudoviricetes sp.]
MPWLKVSDTAAQHRIVWRALEIPGASMQSMWSLFGQVLALAVEAAAFKTDYIIERGSVLKFTGTPEAAEKFIADAMFCGYLTDQVPLDDGRIAYKLVEDEDLFHMRLREEIDWENRRRNDTRNGALIVPIRARDGDACRWCGNVVYWGNQKGGRGATYDHLNPGVPAETPEDMVVACRSCNSSRKDNAGWAVDLLPAPKTPYFSAKSAAWLTENGVPTKASAPSDKPVGRSVVATSQVREFSRSQIQNQGTGDGDGSQVIDEPLPAVQATSQVREFSRSQIQNQGTGNGDGSQVIDEPLPVVHANSSLPTISAQQMIDEFSAQIDAAELALAEQASAAEVVEELTSVAGAPATEESHNDHFLVPKTTSQDPSQDWEELGGDLNQEGDGFESAGSGRDGNGQGTARGSEQSAPVTDPSAGTQAANSSQLLRIDLNHEGDGFESAGSGRDGKADKNLTTSESKRPRHRRARPRRTRR